MLPATIHNLKKLKWILLDEIRCLFILDKALFRPDSKGNTSCSQHVSLKFYECPPSLAAFCRAIHFNAYTLNNNLAVLQEQFSKLSNAAQDELTQRGLGIEDLSSSYTTSNRILSGMLTATCNALTQEEQEQFIHEMIWELPAEYEE